MAKITIPQLLNEIEIRKVLFIEEKELPRSTGTRLVVVKKEDYESWNIIEEILATSEKIYYVIYTVANSDRDTTTERISIDEEMYQDLQTACYDQMKYV
jgi:DNA-directed RNA polymerase subunit L